MSQNPSANLFTRQTSSDPEELREFEPMADHGPKWTYFIGMWLYFGSSVAYGVCGLVFYLLGNPNIGSAEVAGCLAIGLGSALVLFFVTRRFVRLRAIMNNPHG